MIARISLLTLAFLLFLSPFSKLENGGGFLAEIFRVFAVAFTALLIFVCENRRISPWVLRTPILVEIGDLSYAWYLVHWPCIQFAVYWSPEGLNFVGKDFLWIFGGKTVKLEFFGIFEEN